jgi:hypothetical protein
MWLNKLKQTQRIRLVNTERPVRLSQPGFNRSEVPRNMNKKEKLTSLSIFIIILLLLALEFIIKCAATSLPYRNITVSLQ